MKTFLQILAIVSIVGGAIGVVATKATTKPYVPIGQEELAIAHREKIQRAVAERNDPNAKIPVAACDGSQYDFGLMDPLTVAEHTFEIKNLGEASLVIKGGPSSCKCTLSDLENAILEPGETYPVTLRWNSGHASREFQQVAIVNTNDPLNEEIQLIIKGEVRSVLAAIPPTVNLNRLIPEAKTSSQFVLYSQIWDEMEVVRVESSNDHISAEHTDEPYKGAVAKDDEIANAVSGAVFNVKYDGLAERGPLGGFLRVFVKPPKNWLDENQKNKQQADDETEEATRISFPTQDDGTVLCEIPFSGNVVRRMSLYGKSVYSDGRIELGKVHPKKTKGTTWNIVGRIRGTLIPEKVEVTCEGIPGMKATVADVEAAKAKNSFRISLELTEELAEAIYTKDQAGKLTIKAHGMPTGDDLLEMPISLTVIKYKLLN